MWFIDRGMSRRQGMDLRRMIWESLVSYRDQCLPSLFLYQCLLSLHDLEFNSVSFVLSQDFPSEITPCFLPESFCNFLDHLTGVIQYSRRRLLAQQLIYIFGFFSPLAKKRKVISWCLTPANLLLLPSYWCSLTYLTSPGQNIRRIYTIWKIHWESVTIIITCAWSDSPSASGLFCLLQVIGFWAPATECIVILCESQEEASSHGICHPLHNKD